MTNENHKIDSPEQIRAWMDHTQQLLHDGATVGSLGNLVITDAQYDALKHAMPTRQSDRETSPVFESPFTHNSFDEARHQPAEPSDQLIESVINHKFGLMNAIKENGQEYASLVLSDLDKSDKEFASSPDQKAQHFVELSNFIGAYSKLFLASLKPPYDEEQKSGARNMLNRQKEFIAESIIKAPIMFSKIGNNVRLDKNTESITRLIGFGSHIGVTFQGKNFYPFDMGKDSGPPIFKSNIAVQSGMRSGFVHASSLRYMRNPNERPGRAERRRIYLNPQTVHTPGIFKAIMEKGDAENLNFHGKIDISGYQGKYGFAHEVSTDPTRTEQIVLAADEQTTDRLLSIVAELYTERPSIFEGRAVPGVAHKIADGIALADESPESGSSFNSHRAAAYAKVRTLVVRKFSPDSPNKPLTGDQLQQAIKYFRQIEAPILESYGIDPHNPAFNLK